MSEEGDPDPKRIEIRNNHIREGGKATGGRGCPVYLALREQGVDVEYVDPVRTLIREKAGRPQLTELENDAKLARWIVARRDSIKNRSVREATLELDQEKRTLTLKTEKMS